MSQNPRITLTFIVLLAMTTLAWAQVRPLSDRDKWEVTFLAGVDHLAGGGHFTTASDSGSPQEVVLGTDPGFLLGLRIAENRGRFFGAEVEYSWGRYSGNLNSPTPALPGFELDQSVHNLLYSGLFHLKPRRSRLRPYAIIGGGATLFAPSGSSKAAGTAAGLDLKRRWKFAVGLGGGLSWNLQGPWRLRIEFRDRITGVPNYGSPLPGDEPDAPQAPALHPQGLFHALQWTVGLVYVFNSS